MMSKKVDFYIYDISDYQLYQKLVCNIIEETYNLNKNVLLLCENEECCEIFDQLLWTYKDIGFIPHKKKYKNSITTQRINSATTDCSITLMNLSYSFPDSLETYNQIIEMSGYDENSRQKARQNFKKYRTMNFEINPVQVKL